MTRNASKVWEDFFRPLTPPLSSSTDSTTAPPPTTISVPEIKEDDDSSISSPPSPPPWEYGEEEQEQIVKIFSHLHDDDALEAVAESKEAKDLVNKLEELPESPHEEIESVMRDVAKKSVNTLERRITMRTVLEVVSKEVEDAEESIKSLEESV